MDTEKDTSINDLRFRFTDLSKELERLRDEWHEAHSKKDIDRETRLVRRETDLFNQVNDVVKDLAGLLKQSRAA